MATADELRAKYAILIGAFAQGGAAQTTVSDRQHLALLYAREAHKGAMKLTTTDLSVARTEAIAHLTREFVDDADLKVVIDYKHDLLRSAALFAHRPAPLEAVILYAVWAEHWLNGMLIVAALAGGQSEDDAAQMLRESKVNAKLGWLWRQLGLAPLDSTHRSRLQLLFEVRNEYLHYKWTGKDPAAVAPIEARLQQALADIQDTVRYAHELELASIEPHVLEGERLFEAPGAMDALRSRYAEP